MKVTFIGHGLKGNTDTVGDYICSSLKSDSYDSFTVFSAFTKMSGINIFKEELLEAKKKYKEIKFYLGIVERGTSKEVLEFLISNNIDTWFFCTSSSVMFHPKIYFFKGKNKARFFTGSSNLTKPGLLTNIEASTLLEFNPNNTQSKKFLTQFNDYFDSILNGTDNNTEKLDKEKLNDLIDAGFVDTEHNTNDDYNQTKRNSELFKKRKKAKFIKDELGDIKEQNHRLNDYKYEIKITEQYLETWEELFQEYKEYIIKENRKSVARNYENQRLYTWYRKQKIFYAQKLIPKEHIKKLEQVGFYFGDSRKLKWKNIEEEWLDILLDALIDKEDVKLNHRYIYKGRKLGTWLTGINQKNKKGEKLELRKTINEVGFYFKDFTRDIDHVVGRFIRDLLERENPKKGNFKNRFNHQIVPKKETMSPELIQEVIEAYELRFGEKPNWEVGTRVKDKTREWKDFRYDKLKNPEGKWFKGQKHLGEIYNWVWHKKRDIRKMNLVKDKFNETEKMELRNEGFPI